MQYLIKSGNAYGLLRIELKAHEFIYACDNALCGFGGEITFTKSKPTGLLRRLARKFSSAHFPFQQISGGENEGWVMLSPSSLGMISAVDLHGKTVLVAKENFLASRQSVATNGKLYPLAKQKFVKEDFEVIRFSGEGLLFLNGCGAIESLSLLPEQTMAIDPYYLIAWEEPLVFSDSDQGFIRVTGPGRLWMQTRSPRQLDQWLDGLKEDNKSANS